MSQTERLDAVYHHETPVKCPCCRETIATLKAVRRLREQVSFISTLPNRGRVVACPECRAMLPAKLTNL